MATAQPEKRGCFKSALVGIGCGCIYPAMFLLLLAVVAFFFLADPVKQLATAPGLPEFSGPEQEHFWSLQEKRLDLQNSQNKVLQLTTAEFNAFLTFYQFPPANGACIHKIRFVNAADKGTFYLICSGFFMRNLIIQVEINNQGSLDVAQLRINNLTINSGTWLHKHSLNWIRSLISSNAFKPAEEVISRRATFNFDQEKIEISGSLLQQ